MLGALCHYITHTALKDFQPMKANFGILPPLVPTPRLGKRERAKLFAERAQVDLKAFITENKGL
jgi:methylenetetrahydrofolate--tRNA-(uracil-5-)-methyltransferase